MALLGVHVKAQGVVPSSILCSAGDPFPDLLSVELVSLYRIGGIWQREGDEQAANQNF